MANFEKGTRVKITELHSIDAFSENSSRVLGHFGTLADDLEDGNVDGYYKGTITLDWMLINEKKILNKSCFFIAVKVVPLHTDDKKNKNE